MTTTHLVIQSPALSQDQVELAAALSQAEGVQRISATAARLLDVDTEAITQEQIRHWGESANVDTAFVPAGIKLSDVRVLAMDMDSTLINIECIDEIAAFGGVKEQVASITEAVSRACPSRCCSRYLTKSFGSIQERRHWSARPGSTAYVCCSYQVDLPFSPKN